MILLVMIYGWIILKKELVCQGNSGIFISFRFQRIMRQCSTNLARPLGYQVRPLNGSEDPYYFLMFDGEMVSAAV